MRFSRIRRWAKFSASLLLLLVLLLVSAVLFTGCRAFFHGTTTLEERLAMFPTTEMPLREPVTVYWNDYQVPFIDAQHDLDLAFVMGVVHHHLRAGQLALLKRVSQGRLSEMAGPLAVDIDHALRILDLGYASPAIVEAMPTDTKAFLAAFVDGLNFHRTRTKRPPEAGLLNLDDEPYTLEDLVTISRLAGADVNWGIMIQLFNARERPDYQDIFTAFQQRGLHSSASYQVHPELQQLSTILTGLSKSGSNAFAVGAQHTENGAAMLANDPHLGQFVPNFWILLGYRSPSYHAVGFAVPGLPFLGLGRNKNLAWGGTNMQGASSDLYDVSHLTAEDFRESEKRIKVRFGRDRTIKVRRSDWGPLFSDAPLVPAKDGEILAIKWVGHEVSDEFSAFLKANRATSIEAFREAFASYGVSGQNLLVAEDSGRIAHIPAIRLPLRPFDQLPQLVLDAQNPEHQWRGLVSANKLPFGLDPEEGFIASANNKPAAVSPPFGFFFGPSTRVDRLKTLLSAEDKVSLDDAKRILRDAYDINAHQLAQQWGKLLLGAGVAKDPFSAWDGQYRAESREALLFERFTAEVATRYHEQQSITGVKASNWMFILNETAPGVLNMAPEQRDLLIKEAWQATLKSVEDEDTWGDFHRLRVQHPLGNIPLLGRRFRFGDLPIDGSRQTLLKTAHGLVTEQHQSRFGSQSRHISLMDDIDHNYFVLLGGNDGWLGSANIIDQLDLWLAGDYLHFPMRIEKIQTAFQHKMELAPAP